MGTAIKLLLIAALAPLGVMLVFLFAVGKGDPKSLALFVIAYPVMLVATLLLGFLLHRLFRRRHMGRSVQFIVVVVTAILGGLMITLLVMTPRLSNLSQLPALLIRESRETLYFFGFWSSLGVGTALLAWLLYSFGPLKLSCLVLVGVFLSLLTPSVALAQSAKDLRRVEEMDRACESARADRIRQAQRQKIAACLKEPPEPRAAPKTREDCERYWGDYGWVQGSRKSGGTRPHLFTDLPACRRAAEARRKFEGR